MLPHAPLEPNNNPQQTQFHPTRPPAKEIRGQLHTPQGANPNAARVLLIGAEDTDTHAPRAPSRCLMSETTIFQSAFTKCIMHRRSDNCGRVAALAGGEEGAPIQHDSAAASAPHVPTTLHKM